MSATTPSVIRVHVALTPRGIDLWFESAARRVILSARTARGLAARLLRAADQLDPPLSANGHRKRPRR